MHWAGNVNFDVFKLNLLNPNKLSVCQFFLSVFQILIFAPIFPTTLYLFHFLRLDKLLEFKCHVCPKRKTISRLCRFDFH